MTRDHARVPWCGLAVASLAFTIPACGMLRRLPLSDLWPSPDRRATPWSARSPAPTDVMLLRVGVRRHMASDGDHPAVSSYVDYRVPSDYQHLVAMLADPSYVIRDAAQREIMKAARAFGQRQNVRYVFVLHDERLIGVVDRWRDL